MSAPSPAAKLLTAVIPPTEHSVTGGAGSEDAECDLAAAAAGDDVSLPTTFGVIDGAVRNSDGNYTINGSVLEGGGQVGAGWHRQTTGRMV